MLRVVAEQEADDAEVPAVVGGSLLDELGREQPARHRRCQRAEHVVEAPQATVDDDADGAAALGFDRLDGRPCAHLAAQGDDLVLERIDQRLVAALEPAHHLAPALVAGRAHPARSRPDVGGREVGEIAVELGVEQRLPQLLDDTLAGVAPEPLLERLVVEPVVLLRQLAAGDEQRQPGALARAQKREGEELLRRGHREEATVAVEADPGRPEPPAVAETELVGEADHAVIGREHDVVEAVDSGAVEVERADEPAEVRRALVERDGDAGLSKPIGGGHPEDAPADDPDRRLHAPRAPSVAAGRGSGAVERSRKSIRQ